MARKRLPPFELEVTHLGPKGVGVGEDSGRTFRVRGAPPGSRIRVVPAGKRKGVWNGRRLHMVRPPATWVEPPCAVFGTCGGCLLQEISLEAQRTFKESFALGQVDIAPAVRVHAIRGDERAYSYRNKIEMSFGSARFLTETDHRAGLPIDGKFLGFHAPGRFDRVVDTHRCALVDDAVGEVVQLVRDHALGEGPAAWNPREQSGFWRHLLLRRAEATGEILAAIYTTSPENDEATQAAVAVAEAAYSHPDVVGVLWILNDGVADVARGEVERLWGRDWIEERLGDVSFRLSATSFFQTNTAAALVLYDTIGEALGPCRTLVDLYCGIGSIGLYLSHLAERVTGVEEVQAAVDDAVANAARNGVSATYRCAKAEDALEAISGGPGVGIVVDPPRAGLHPKVSARLAATRADVLVYVACNPASLGRDAAILASGWTMTDVWTVDLFPQTGHIEMIGRFVRKDT